jgi:hypothetical protein
MLTIIETRDQMEEYQQGKTEHILFFTQGQSINEYKLEPGQ